ncbi:Protein of unknown function [Propionibacterium freudenreichii]|nr:Protein of unknown function [Propionibacterium freudenreichii]
MRQDASNGETTRLMM